MQKMSVEHAMEKRIGGESDGERDDDVIDLLCLISNESDTVPGNAAATVQSEDKSAEHM